MNNMLVYEDETEESTEESVDVGSFNHSTIQVNLAYLLKRLGVYTVSADLSLDVSNVDLSEFHLLLCAEVKPDLCVYSKRKLDPANDILRMTEMPLLAIEIVSPRQGLYEITEKFKLYFQLGVRSCWLVIPNTQTVTVYSAIHRFQTFVSGEVVDEELGIRLSLAEIFD